MPTTTTIHKYTARLGEIHYKRFLRTLSELYDSDFSRTTTITMIPFASDTMEITMTSDEPHLARAFSGGIFKHYDWSKYFNPAD